MSLYKMASVMLEKKAHMMSATFHKVEGPNNQTAYRLMVDKDALTANEKQVLLAMKRHLTGHQNANYHHATAMSMFKRMGVKIPKELKHPDRYVSDKNKGFNFDVIHATPEQAAYHYYGKNYHKINELKKPKTQAELQRNAIEYATKGHYNKRMAKYKNLDNIAEHNNYLEKKYQEEDRRAEAFVEAQKKQQDPFAINVNF